MHWLLSYLVPICTIAIDAIPHLQNDLPAAGILQRKKLQLPSIA